MVFKKLRRKLKLGKFKRTGEKLKIGKPTISKKKTVIKTTSKKSSKKDTRKKKREDRGGKTRVGKVIQDVTRFIDAKDVKTGERIFGDDVIKGTVPIGPAGAAGTAGAFGKNIATGIRKGTFGKDIASVSFSVHGHKLTQTAAGAEKLIGFGTRTVVRNFVGRPSIPKNINKIFHAVRPEATRFAKNTKSLGLTQKMIAWAKSPVGITTIVGSYPFAGFIKEEALQTIGLGFFSAEKINDIEGMELAIKAQEDILDVTSWERLVSLVPYANTAKQLKDFFKAAIIKLEISKRVLDNAKEEQAAGETDFQRERRESDEAARERTLQFRAEDEEYYNEIEAERLEDKEKGREEDSDYYRKIAEENRARKLKEREEDEAYYAQFR